jgi:hypothetical protein
MPAYGIGGSMYTKFADLNRALVKSGSKPAIDLSKAKLSAFSFEEEQNDMILSLNGRRIASFYFNMRGYNQNFWLRNSEGLSVSLPGEMSKSKAISAFREAFKRGFVFLTPY